MTYTTSRRSLLRYLFPACLFCAVSISAQAQEITVAWRNKPPEQYLDNGVAKGVLLERAQQVFSDAHIPTKFVEEPAKRIWNNFSSGVPNYCSFGWYRIPEREALVQFSAIFHTDPPHTLLVTTTAVPQVQKHKTLASLMQDNTLTLGVVANVSYGPVLDALIKGTHNKVERSSAAPMVMAHMVAANRASFMLIDRGDWEYLRTEEDWMHNLVQMDLKDMPPGLNRYIVCSKDVPATTMQKIDVAIAKIMSVKKGP